MAVRRVERGRGVILIFVVALVGLAAVRVRNANLEIHPNPDKALSDGAQSLTFENFRILMDGVRSVAQAVGKSMAPALSEAVPG